MSSNRITTARQLRQAFWRDHPNMPRRKIANYSGNGTMYRTDTRVAWNDYKDSLQKSGVISQKLAENTFL